MTHDVTPEGHVKVAITDELLARAERVGLDMAAAIGERVTRFAVPEERKEVGLRIDPETAFVFFQYAQTFDPYGDGLDIDPEYQQVGREWFACDPNEGVAVALQDLPRETRTALFEKQRTADAEGWRRIASA